MTHVESEILYEMQRVDLEFAVVKSMERELRRADKNDAADKVKEAADCLQRATFLLNAARKWVDISVCDQLKMDFMED